MAGKYVDLSSIIQVIGSVFINPNLLEQSEKYHFNEEDFTEEFHKILFGSIYNLYELGAVEISIAAIENYLEQRPTKMAIYKTNKGAEYLLKLKETTQLAAFDYYYNRMKKMTLLRMYDSIGMNLSWLYDVNNILDVKKKQAQEDWLDNTPIAEIADLIDTKITSIRTKYVENAESAMSQAGDGLFELVEDLEQNPEIGVPLYGPLINTITRGARLKKIYMRSAAQGTGKTRSMIADACYFACDRLFDTRSGQWICNGQKEPTLFITTEQEKSEIQTMMLAFIANVDEEHILTGKYLPGERERVLQAVTVIKESPLYIEELPDFSLQDIENTIKLAINQYGVRYVCHDYIHSSMKILSEISSKAGVKGLREDNILFMIGVRLKDLANKYGIFILTATQLSGQYQQAEVLDQNYLRGAKSLADKIDLGAIMIRTTPQDLEMLKPLLDKGGFEVPAIKMSIYKNRRGRYKDILLWCRADTATCRIEPLFATNYQFEWIEIPDLVITVQPNEANK